MYHLQRHLSTDEIEDLLGPLRDEPARQMCPRGHHLWKPSNIIRYGDRELCAPCMERPNWLQEQLQVERLNLAREEAERTLRAACAAAFPILEL